jgi:4-diphosphocytidyl-2-C-methyl-D-erythritol kinase
MLHLSPAKINTTLKVVGKRSDGYHELDTVMQMLTLVDVMQFERSGRDKFVCSDRSLPVDSGNLVIQARDLFRERTGFTQSVEIELIKRIPHQAGLGGGSSNAATTLLALNELAGSPATTEQLMQWGAELGSDVPFFFCKGRARCTGRGEIIEPLLPVEQQAVWIVKPAFGLSTPEVYRRVTIDSSATRDAEYFNDLESAAFEAAPALKAIKAELKNHCTTVQLCGSGTSFFCLGAKPPSLPETTVYETQFGEAGTGE